MSYNEWVQSQAKADIYQMSVDHEREAEARAFANGDARLIPHYTPHVIEAARTMWDLFDLAARRKVMKRLGGQS